MRLLLRATLACALALAGCATASVHGGGDHDAAVDSGAGDGGATRDARPDGSPAAVDAAGTEAGLPVDAAPTDAPAAEAGPPADAAPADVTCTAVTAAPDVDPWAMRLPSAGFGGITTDTSSGHTDVFLSSPTGYIRVGVRLDWGGSVVFFGLAADPASNVIDANDTGRELQIALYDPARAMQPCAHDASCLTVASCGASITYLGWDPVQGGDECGHGATVVSYGQVGDALEVVVQPLQWNPDWDATDCRESACGTTGVAVAVLYTLQLRFIAEHVVEVALEVASQEALTHDPTAQEFPTLYVSHGLGGPPLPLLLDASGQAVSLATAGNDGFFYGSFTSPAPWVTWQDAAQDYGVGLASDQGLTAFQGWRGDGTSAPYFHNVRPQIAFGLPAGGTVRGVSYLALGSFATVAGQLGAALGTRGPFGVVDAPAAGATAHYGAAPLTVAGWVLDTAHLASVRIEIDGALAVTLPVTVDRGDVCALYPAYDGCPAVGYGGAVPTSGLGPCAHLLRVVAVDADGNPRTLGERVIAP
jgi:hypothetical protein